jgi:predicted dehydrogenase
MFGEAIRGQGERQPDFDTAVELHRLVDSILLSSEQRQTVTI